MGHQAASVYRRARVRPEGTSTGAIRRAEQPTREASGSAPLSLPPTEYRPAMEAAQPVAHTSGIVPWPDLLLAYLKLGAISIGGRSAPYLLTELVERRRWLQKEDFLEGLLLGYVLPGPVGASCAMFLATRLRGPRAAVPALAMYTLPGIALALVLSVLVFGMPRPPWANGAIYTLSATAFGFFIYAAVRLLPGTRKTRLGPVMVVGAFVAHGLLAVDLLPVLIGLGGFSLLLNRPAPRQAEGE
jgi:chromate transporter